jgi:inhibitor of cysteine peptidase
MKGSKTAIAIILGMFLVVGIACGGKSESPTPTPTQTPTQTPMPTLTQKPTPTPVRTIINVNESDSGSTITLGHSQFLAVTLDSNPGSTGFSWNLSAISDTDMIQWVSDEYIAPEQTDPPMVGVPGQEVWTFEALAAGTATISMKYIQPWQPEAEPAETFEITVNVE